MAQLSVPWSEQVIDGTKLPKNGAASYYLKILLPTGMDSVSFAVPAVFNSYAFWVNDQLICNSGTVSARKEVMRPRWMPQTVVVAAPDDTLHVIFQIANFQNTRGGCAEIMRIGDPHYLPAMSRIFYKGGYAMLFLFTVIGMACLIIYGIWRIKSFLFLGFLSFAYLLRFLFSDLYFSYDVGLKLSWMMVARIEYGTVPIIVLSGAFFLSSIYPQEFRKKVLYFFAGINSTLVLLVIFSPTAFFFELLSTIQIIALLFLFYVIYVVVKAVIYRRVGAWITALGLAVFAVVGLYNIYALINIVDLNRLFIYCGYASALVLNIVSLLYRTPIRLRTEEQDILRFSDLYGDQTDYA